MGTKTNIEWADHTFNPWRGCQHATLSDGAAHPGCDHCYAEAMSKLNPATLGVWGDGGTRVVAAEKQWKLPAKWNAAAEKAGVRRKVFCASLADVFEDWRGSIHDAIRKRMMIERGGDWIQPETPQGDFRGMRPLTMDDLRRRLFDQIDATPWLDWLILTKRPENVLRMWPRYTYDACATGDCPHELQSECGQVMHRENVWLLASVSDQETYDRFAPIVAGWGSLSPVRGLSVEPQIGPIDYRAKIPPHYAAHLRSDRVNWLIVGGESGPHARPFCERWAHDAIAIGREARIAVFVKQLGAKPVVCDPETGDQPIILDLQDKKGGDWNEWPADLRVRQFPEVVQ